MKDDVILLATDDLAVEAAVTKLVSSQGLREALQKVRSRSLAEGMRGR